MTISIDYDNTWTSDPALWTAFTALCRSRDHEVVIVTNRDETQPIPAVGPRVIYAGRMLKKDATNKRGVKIDVWIDDSPATIERCLYLDDQENI